MDAAKLATVLAALALAAAGCGDDDSGDGAAEQQPAEQGQADTQPTERGDTTEDGEDADAQSGEQTTTINGQRINLHDRGRVSDGTTEVELDSFYFEPSILAGPGGQRARLRLTNDSDLPHTFTLREQDVDAVVDPGQSATVTVTLPDTGQTVFVCRFHTQQGMRGALDAIGGSEPGADDRGGEREDGADGSDRDDDSGSDERDGDQSGGDGDGRY